METFQRSVGEVMEVFNVKETPKAHMIHVPQFIAYKGLQLGFTKWEKHNIRATTRCTKDREPYI